MPKKKKTAFEKLAEKRGVNLKKEQERARSQKKSGKTISPLTKPPKLKVTPGRTTEEVEASKRQTAEQATPADANFSSVSGSSQRVEPPPTKEAAPAQSALQTFVDDQRNRFQNVVDVYRAILPGGGGVTADVQNKIIAHGLEEGANNPATTALAVTGVVGIARALLARAGTALTNVAVQKEAKKQLKDQFLDIKALKATPIKRLTPAINTKNGKLMGGALAKAGFTIGAAYILKEGFETYTFSKFQINEALQTIGMARYQAIQAGRDDLLPGLEQLQDEVINPAGWEAIARSLPWLNLLQTAEEQVRAAQASQEVFNKIIENEQVRVANNENSDDYWERVRTQEEESNKRNIDYYNSERKKLLQFELEARRNAQAAKRESDIKARNEDAAFWRKEREKQAELEEKDREAIAEFWAEYRKRLQQVEDANRPSNLNFGLI